MNKKSLKGFTLAELLIVVVIIGVLASVALPSYRVATEKAKVAAMLPILRSVREAQHQHFLEHRVPVCDLSKLNVKIDYVTDEVRMADRKNADGSVICDGPVNVETGECTNPRQVPRFCGVAYNSQGLPAHEDGSGVDALFDYDNPEYQGEPIWKSRNGLTEDDLGYSHMYRLANKDNLVLQAHQVDLYTHTNSLNIDYHLLGTSGEIAGQWSYTGCKRKGDKMYNRCDAICYGRKGIWDAVCRSLANGKFAGSTNGQDPNTISEEHALLVGGNFPDSILWCIGGTSQQVRCPEGSTGYLATQN